MPRPCLSPDYARGASAASRGAERGDAARSRLGSAPLDGAWAGVGAGAGSSIPCPLPVPAPSQSVF